MIGERFGDFERERKKYESNFIFSIAAFYRIIEFYQIYFSGIFDIPNECLNTGFFLVRIYLSLHKK